MPNDTYAADGQALDLDGLPTTISYNGDGTVDYIQVTRGAAVSIGVNSGKSYYCVDSLTIKSM